MRHSLLFCFFLLTNSFLFAQPTQQWLNRYNGDGDFSDRFNCSVTDGLGNVYLGGYTIGTSSRMDYLIVKIDASGSVIWSQTYDGLGGKDDEILAMAIDASSNIYITGYSKGIGSENDVVTMKYDANGSLFWSAIYNNSSAMQDDQGQSIALDNLGNVYVTGYTDIDPSATDNDNYLTLKYDNSGLFLWSTLYEGTAFLTDRASNIVTDATGNIYVTGKSTTFDYDITTISYNSSGGQLWVNTFDNGADDLSADMVIDLSGNVYVVGKSNNGTDDDYVILSYSSIGTDLIGGGLFYDGVGAGIDRPSGITVDGSGNIYVTGKSDADATLGINYDYCTIMFDAGFNLIWDSYFNGSGNGTDETSDLLYSSNGLVYVTGRSDIDPDPLLNDFNIQTLAYDNSGVVVYSQSYQGTASLDEDAKCIVENSINQIFVAGYTEDVNTQSNALVFRYSSTMTFDWDQIYNGTGDNSDNVNAMAVDGAGFTYLAGYTYSKSALKDWCVIKINTVGDTVWTRTYNGTDNGNDEANDIRVDGNGNIYVTGYAKENGTDYDVTTIKYNPSGTQLWFVQYDNLTVNQEDIGLKILLDNSGNVYVAGSTDRDFSAINNQDYLVLKYSNSGVQQWVKTYNGLGNSDDVPAAFGYMSATDKIVVTGLSSNGTDDDYTTICYNSAGTQQWLKRYDGLLGNDRPNDLAVDASERVTVTGRKFNSQDYDAVTIQYTNAGVQNWLHTYSNGLNDDRGIAVAVDNSGNAFVTASTTNAIQANTITYKITNTGAASWSNVYNGSSNLDDIPSDILIDGNGYIVIGGMTTGSATFSDFFLRKYNASGAVIWSTTYDNLIGKNDVINCIAIDPASNLYVSGSSYSTIGQKDIVTIKYNSPLGINELSDNDNNTTVYPNPFDVSTSVSLNNSSDLEFDLSLYTMSGTEIGSFHTSSGKVEISRSTMESGMYLFRIYQKNEMVSQGKLVVR